MTHWRGLERGAYTHVGEGILLLWRHGDVAKQQHRMLVSQQLAGKYYRVGDKYWRIPCKEVARSL